MKKILAGFVLLLVSGCGLGLGRVTVTKAEYDQIQSGMTYSQVQSIVGGAGKEASRTSLMGETLITYAWENPDGSNASASFKNDTLMFKLQIGLQ